MLKYLLLLFTHGAVGIFGFALGIYLLPILIAPEAPSDKSIQETSQLSQYEATFTRNLKGSDTFHWGEGKVFINRSTISFMGELAPGPDYKLYLSPVFVETEADFNSHKASMVKVGEVKTFNNFLVELNGKVDIDQFSTVIVWCETFGEFITAAKYQD